MTPTEVKRRRGTLRKGRQPREPLTVLPTVAMVPREPTGLDFVQSILDAGASAWIGTTDMPILELLAEAVEERKVLVRLVADDLANANLRKALRDLEKQITSWLSLLGLTPSDRSRLGVAEVKARSKLEELAEKRAGRRAI